MWVFFHFFSRVFFCISGLSNQRNFSSARLLRKLFFFFPNYDFVCSFKLTKKMYSRQNFIISFEHLQDESDISYSVERISSVFRMQNVPSRLDIIAGGLAGCTEVITLYPFDVVKTRLQTSHSQSPSILNILKSTTRDGGIKRCSFRFVLSYLEMRDTC